MFFLYNVLDPTKQSINVEKSKWHKGFVQEVKRLQQKFWSLSAILLFLWQIKSSLSNASILETRNTNKNTSAPTDLSSFVNPNKQNLCQDDEKSQEANHKENRRKCSRKKKENIEGLIWMNMPVLIESEEQQKFLEGPYKQQK